MGWWHDFKHGFSKTVKAPFHFVSDVAKTGYKIGKGAVNRTVHVVDTGIGLVDNTAKGLGGVAQGIGNVGTYLPVILIGGAGLATVYMLKK